MLKSDSFPAETYSSDQQYIATVSTRSSLHRIAWTGMQLTFDVQWQSWESMCDHYYFARSELTEIDKNPQFSWIDF